MKRYSTWPVPEIGAGAVLSVIEQGKIEGRLGVDLEYSSAGPTIIGVASRERCAAWNWEAHLGYAVLASGVPLSAHSGIGADKPVIERPLAVTTDLDRWSDTMVRHWIVNPDLSSVPKSLAQEERDDPETVFAFMNLWTATSLLHDVPNWKQCFSPLDKKTWQPTDHEAAAKCAKAGRVCPYHRPMEYCAVDSWAGLVNDYSLIEQMRVYSIPESYYQWRARLTEYCDRISAKGVRIDLDVVTGLEKAIQSRKATLFPAKISYEGKPYKDGRPRLLKKPRVLWEGPFNPNSPKAVLTWFHENGITLMDRGGKPSMGKPIVLAALEKQLKPYGLTFNPRTGEIEEDIDVVLPEPVDLLLRLAQKTIAGKGLKSWFDASYLLNGRAHPRFISTGTSTSRLSSARPNFQNIPRVGFGAEVRRAIVAEPGCKVLKADFSQLEFRICLWAAGLDPNLADGAFELLTERSEGQFQAAADRLSWKPRDVAKSVVHGGDYLEGLKIYSAKDLSKAKIIAERREGALLVYDGRDLPEWTFRGGYVCFTGGNLAERLFGNRTRESRAKALKIQQVYLDAFPQIRAFQKKVGQEIEHSHEVRLPSGHRVPLYGRSPEDDLKYGAAVWGQGGGAIYAQEGMLNFEALGFVMNLQVHDELVFTDIPLEWSDEQCLDFMRPMVVTSTMLPGFVCPAKVSVSRVGTWRDGDKEITATTHNWKQTVELGTIR